MPLIRTHPTKPLVAVVTSDDLLGCHTHYWRGRTVPCEVQGCKPCEDGMPFRWHAWLTALTEPQRTHIIFEITAQAAENFVTYRKANGTLRGCRFRASRPAKTPNGRVRIECRPQDLSKISLPEAPNLVKCMSIIWNIALVDVDVADMLKEVPHVHVDDRNKPMFVPSNGTAAKQTHAPK